MEWKGPFFYGVLLRVVVSVFEFFFEGVGGEDVFLFVCWKVFSFFFKNVGGFFVEKKQTKPKVATFGKNGFKKKKCFLSTHSDSWD